MNGTVSRQKKSGSKVVEKARAKAVALENPDRICVTVLGMHRSGTSALTRAISLLGASIPKRLIGADTNNQSGYWEPASLNALHNKMLTEAGSRWDDWRAFNIADLSRPRAQFYRAEIARLLDEEYGVDPFIVLKDPRISRFVALYADILEAMKIDTRYVLTVRNPLAVAASLGKRDNLALSYSMLLWLRHVLEAERATRGKLRAFVSYEDMVRDWRPGLEKITDALSIAWPRGLDEAAAEIDAHFSSDHQHNVASDAQLFTDERIIPWVKHTYSALKALEADARDSEAKATLDRVMAEFNAVSPIFGEAFYQELASRQRDFVQVRDELQRLAKEKEAENERLLAHAEEREPENWRLLAQAEEREAENERLLAQAEEREAENERLAGRTKQQAEIIEHLRAKFVSEREELHKAAERRTVEIDTLKRQNTALNARTDTLKRDRDQARVEVERLRRDLDAVYVSTSWRISAPIRAVKRGMRAIATLPSAGRACLSRLAHAAWQNLPISVGAKKRLKSTIFQTLPFLFQGTTAYRVWKKSNAFNNGPRTANLSVPTDSQVLPDGDYVSRLNAPPLVNVPARLIAFYLPQFHPTPENDAFWGKGFTEWTNVRTAQPQFEGHYQPHVPGDLGYYNLLDPEVQRRQIELAKLYGVGGFCFYFYWFNGHRPLEKPLENYIDDSKLDLPFCLCWANENWTRTWDGRENEILLAQNHSPEDDLAFIAHVSKYLRDPRYIRINGKPLLLVYRPNILPSAKETAQRWREWCRNNGVGEIYLAYTQSFERVDPAIYDFDAAIEFPPNMEAKSLELPDLSKSVKPLRKDFACSVLDWSFYTEKSQDYNDPGYTIFRAVCPGWDNTARRKQASRILYNSSPSGYFKWLFNAITETCHRLKDPEEHLVFVNAWNEWGEGAHLEPDSRYGYAYLEATRLALADVSFDSDSQFGYGPISRHLNYHAQVPDPVLTNEKICVQLHLFHTGLADHFATLLARLGQKHTLLISVQESEETSVWEDFFASRVPLATKVIVKKVPNRGRDVLPWVVSFADEIEKHTLFFHLHTKKSEYENALFDWRSFLEHSTFGSRDLINQILGLFADNPSLGLVYPPYFSGLSDQPAWGGNEKHFETLLQRLSTEPAPNKCPDFPSGSFFWARTRALLPLFNLKLTIDDFPEEAGQIDGTPAHAIERIVGILPDIVGMTKLCVAVDTPYHLVDLCPNPSASETPQLDAPSKTSDVSTDSGHKRIEHDSQSLNFGADDLITKSSLTVSVIIPTWNRRDHVAAAVTSAFDQSFSPQEIIVVDDGSTDGSVSYLTSMFPSEVENGSLKFICLEHQGVSAARNAGLDVATGDIISYLDSDNTWRQDYLAHMVSAFERYPNAISAYSNFLLHDADKGQTRLFDRPYNRSDLLQENFIDLNVFAHRRSVTELGHRFDTTLKRLVDWDFIIRATSYRAPLHLQYVGADYNLNEKGLRNITRTVPLEENIQRVRRKHRRERVYWQHEPLSFAIKCPAPNELVAHEWGDYHFARSLCRSLERVGCRTRIDFLRDWESAESDDDDVVLVVRGLSQYKPKPGRINIMWLISHPDKVSLEEMKEYDHVFVASSGYARSLRSALGAKVTALLQCADPEVFGSTSDRPLAQFQDHELLFVGNSRGVDRWIPKICVERKLPIHVYGAAWDGRLPATVIKGTHIENHKLGSFYRSAKIVLNDHWPSMAKSGFVSNRIFDAGLAGALVISDKFVGSEVFFGSVVTCEDADEVERAVRYYLSNEQARQEKARHLQMIVRAMHTFDMRIEVILRVVRSLVHFRLDPPGWISFGQDSFLGGVRMEQSPRRYGNHEALNVAD